MTLSLYDCWTQCYSGNNASSHLYLLSRLNISRSKGRRIYVALTLVGRMVKTWLGVLNYLFIEWHFINLKRNFGNLEAFRGGSSINLHTLLECFVPGYETFPGFLRGGMKNFGRYYLKDIIFILFRTGKRQGLGLNSSRQIGQENTSVGKKF